jgi:hypothetical protein
MEKNSGVFRLTLGIAGLTEEQMLLRIVFPSAPRRSAWTPLKS